MSKPRINRLKSVLADTQRSQKWLADQLGRDESTVSRWCTNDMQPPVETFLAIANLLDVDIRELFVPTKG